MSVINTETNTIVGSALKVWDEWPLRGPQPRGDGTWWPDLSSQPCACSMNSANDFIVDFNVTIPEGLESTCGEAGKCVLQWYWYAVGNRQTYESCLDFFVEV